MSDEDKKDPREEEKRKTSCRCGSGLDSPGDSGNPCAPRDGRRKRSGGLKPRSIAKKRLTRSEMAEGKELLPYMDYNRPRTRAECRDGIRPCPFVGCRYHLYLDVNPATGNLKLNFPGLEVWQMPFTCAMDVAEMGGRTLEEVGQILNMTRERVRQLEFSALRAIRAQVEKDSLEVGPVSDEDLDLEEL